MNWGRANREAEDAERRERGRTQRIYLLDERRTDDSTVVYDVMGTQGVAYHVTFPRKASTEGKVPGKFSCTCPDYEQRHRTCKHAWHIYDRALGGVAAELAWTQALGRIMAKQDARKKLEKNVRKIYVGEPCAVCLEDMEANDVLVWCEKCGQNVHRACQLRWENLRSATCAFCREPMRVPPLPRD